MQTASLVSVSIGCFRLCQDMPLQYLPGLMNPLGSQQGLVVLPDRSHPAR